MGSGLERHAPRTGTPYAHDTGCRRGRQIPLAGHRAGQPRERAGEIAGHRGPELDHVGVELAVLDLEKLAARRRLQLERYLPGDWKHEAGGVDLAFVGAAIGSGLTLAPVQSLGPIEPR